jgi:molybdopterin converting factor small subunit
VHIAPGPTLDVVTSLAAGLPAEFADVLAVSSLLADGTHVDRSATAPIPAGAVIDVLPPFAGG